MDINAAPGCRRNVDPDMALSHKIAHRQKHGFGSGIDNGHHTSLPSVSGTPGSPGPTFVFVACQQHCYPHSLSLSRPSSMDCSCTGSLLGAG